MKSRWGLSILVVLVGCGTDVIDRRDKHDDGQGAGTGAGGGDGTAGAAGSGPPPGPSPHPQPGESCDDALAIDAIDPWAGAFAMGLCEVYAPGDSWGVMDAQWVRSDGAPITSPALHLGHGILESFGAEVKPKEGHTMLALSSGTARLPEQAGYEDVGGFWKDQSPHGTPAGYPKESPSCPGVSTGAAFDSAGLELTIKTPQSAKSFSYNLNFYTYEFPAWICTEFNDFFVAMLNPVPTGLTDGNISFDALGNTISVNAGFLEVCTPQSAGGKTFDCALGPGPLVGTGYDGQPSGSAATGWLKTTAPVEIPGGVITLRFAIWDSGDGVLDSTVLLDAFAFDAEDQDKPWTVPDL